MNETGAIRLTDASTRTQGKRLPKSKTDWAEWDKDLPCFGLRWRNGKQTWIAQVRVRGKSKRRTIGDASGPFALTAKEARTRAEILLAEIKLGADPHSSRGGLRFGSTAERYVTGLTNGTIGVGRDRARRIKARSLAEIKTHFTLHWREFDNWPLHEIDRKAVATRLAEIAEKSGPVASNRARATLSGFFRWAIGEGIAPANVVTGTNVVPENQSRTRVLDDDEIVDVWNACGENDHGRIVRLLILTAQRRQEVAGMAESELDLVRRLWTLPGERTKNRSEHKVPLSDAALEIIAAQPRRVDRDLLFGDGNGPFSGWSRAKKKLERRIAVARKAAGRPSMKPWGLHDLRRTTRTRLGKLGVLPHISEAVLNHLPAALVQTYDRADYTEEKRQALDLWAQYVKKLVPDEPSNVVNIARVG